MTKEEAKKLVQQYVDGWKTNNLDTICQSLDEHCLIIESHGPTYHGVKDVKNWVDRWVKSKYKVEKWEITSFLFTDDVTVFEWQFAFSSIETPSRDIDGITMVKFEKNKISFLREYRTVKPLYDWNKDKRLNTY